jgi:hypothetical protein
MTGFFTTELSPWPFRSQLEGWTIDGQPSENAASDCAMACIAMVVQWVTGVRLPIDALNDWLFWEGHTGPTPGAKIQSFLAQYCAIPSTDLTATVTTTTGNGTGSLLNAIWSRTVKGLPLIELRQYSPTNTTLHWICSIGCDPTLAFAADPYGGIREAKSYADHGALYRGELLGIDRPRDPNL